MVTVICFSLGGMFSFTPIHKRSYVISKPLSAIMLSPTSNKSNRPERRVIALSDTEPQYRWDINVIAPDGLIATKPLKVLWCL